MKKRFGFVCIVFLMSAMLAMNVGCKGSPSNPSTPSSPKTVTYSIQLDIGAISVATKTYNWDVYVENTKVATLTYSPAGNFTNVKTLTANVQMLETQSESTITVKWTLVSSDASSDWLAGANFQYWMTATSLSSAVTTDPTTQQRVGPFKGWAVGESKNLTFTIRKV